MVLCQVASLKTKGMDRFQIHKLAETETIHSFDCGDEDLNDFILHEASLYRKAKLTTIYILLIYSYLAASL